MCKENSCPTEEELQKSHYWEICVQSLLKTFHASLCWIGALVIKLAEVLYQYKKHYYAQSVEFIFQDILYIIA